MNSLSRILVHLLFNHKQVTIKKKLLFPKQKYLDFIIFYNENVHQNSVPKNKIATPL